jgi:hypothetical protein
MNERLFARLNPGNIKRSAYARSRRGLINASFISPERHKKDVGIYMAQRASGSAGRSITVFRCPRSYPKQLLENNMHEDSQFFRVGRGAIVSFTPEPPHAISP